MSVDFFKADCQRTTSEKKFGLYDAEDKTLIVANRQNQFPSFHKSNAEQRQSFISKYKMRIQFEAEINIE